LPNATGPRHSGSEQPCAPQQNLLCIRLTRVLVSLFRYPRFMDVGGTIGAILSKKGTEVYSIAPDSTVFEAIEMMGAKNVGALLVLQGAEVVGIISERDYTRKVFLKGKRSRETKVEEIMSKDVTVTSSNEPVENCMRLMTEKRIRHLPVVDDGKLRGVLSIGDVVKHIISTQSATIEHLESYIHGGYQ
jgi:CBS domain-containing protein